MKRILAVIFSVILIVMAFPVGVSAEETLKAPTVQHKLINHDKIALRWSKVEGADYYYVYRTDVDTGKTVRYKKSVEGTTTKISDLKAETDYIFKVAAVSEKDGKITVGKKSKGTNVTTPKEWYYTYSSVANPKTHIWEYTYYKENYTKTIRKDVNMDKINYIHDICYYDGWVYFSGAKPVEKKPGSHSGGDHIADLPTVKYIVRFNENENIYEILCDVADGYGCWYSYQINGDYLYVAYNDSEGDYYYIRDLYRISLDDEENITILNIDDCFSGDFLVKDEYVYYLTDWSSFVIDTESSYKQYFYDKKLKENQVRYIARVKIDGTGKEILYEMPDIYGKIYIYNDDLYYYDWDRVYKISLADGETSLLYDENKYYTCDFEIINGYIYFTEYKNVEDQYNKVKPIDYCRIKTDGTGLTKSDKPFEWRY